MAACFDDVQSSYVLGGCASHTTEVSGLSQTVEVSPQSAFLASGQIVHFTATAGADAPVVTWAVNGIRGGSSSVGTIDSNGNFTAPTLTQNATAVITANIEFAECSLGPSSAIYEVTKTSPPTTVWQMKVTGQNTYRATRMPSMYPGVQW